jgi:TatD DNase family protein
LVDTHCHLAFPAFDEDREAAIERAMTAGLAACVVVAVDQESAAAALSLAERHPGWAHPTAGVHPTEQRLLDPGEWPRVAELLDSGRFVAVGESGLDAFHDTVPMEDQVGSLHRHVQAALDRSLPIILHCRDAFERLAGELRAYAGQPLRGVLHCYTGGRAELPALLEAGLHVGVGGIATFAKSGSLRAAVREVPDERLLVETDAPWLAPVPVRGKRNEPAFVAHVARCLATDRGMAPDVFAALTTANADALFGLGLGDAQARRGARPLSPRRPA